MPRLLSLLLLVTTTAAVRGDNLLRNGDFQDDWQTLLPELKNHHWNYTTEVFNRRDYNPDGWRLSGKWAVARRRQAARPAASSCRRRRGRAGGQLGHGQQHREARAAGPTPAASRPPRPSAARTRSRSSAT